MARQVVSSRVISWPLLRRTITDNSNELGHLWPLLSFAILTAVSVRNEEAGGSSPLPSTKIPCKTGFFEDWIGAGAVRFKIVLSAEAIVSVARTSSG